MGKGTAIYPGAVEFKSFHDPGGTGNLTIVEYSGSNLKIEEVELDIRKHQRRNLDISGFNRMDELCDACRVYADPEGMLHLSLTGTPRFPFQEDRLVEELEPDFFYLEIP